MVLERTYNIPLRREYLKVAEHKRTPKAAKALIQFLQKHMKTKQVKIGQHLNEELWKHGIKNPPHHVKVTVIKEDDGVAYAELIGFTFVKKSTKVESKKEKGKLQEMMEKLGGDKKDSGKEVSPEDSAKKLEQKTEEAKKEKQVKAAKQEKSIEKMEEKEELAEKKKTHKAGKVSESKKQVAKEEHVAGN